MIFDFILSIFISYFKIEEAKPSPNPLKQVLLWPPCYYTTLSSTCFIYWSITGHEHWRSQERGGAGAPPYWHTTWGGHHLRLELWSLVFQWRPLLICSLQMSAQKYFNPLWVPWAVVGFWFHCLLFSVTVQQYVTT